MIKIYSKCEPDKLLHLINRFDEIDGRTDIAPEEQFIQAATIKFPVGGKKFRTHQHIWKPSPSKTVIAQESWVVIQGSVKVFMYDTDRTLLKEAHRQHGDKHHVPQLRRPDGRQGLGEPQGDASLEQPHAEARQVGRAPVHVSATSSLENFGVTCHSTTAHSSPLPLSFPPSLPPPPGTPSARRRRRCRSCTRR